MADKIATKTTVQDGQVYQAGETIPDLGTIEAVEVDGSWRRYQCLSRDVQRLPHYVSAGSACLTLDTAQYYRFSEIMDDWYQVGG